MKKYFAAAAKEVAVGDFLDLHQRTGQQSSEVILK
jgi:hypothetical protein